jgi:tRNA-dihydrouridine synthase B
MTDLLRPLSIGKVRLPNNLVLSPMAGFSDLPFRVLCRRHGAGLVCSEMVSATGVLREIPDTLLKMRTLEEEMPMSIQLFGTEPDAVAEAARDVDKRCAILGFNMGCPAHQIKRQGCGAALLDRPDLAFALVEAIKGASDKPLLAKMRLGNGSRLDELAFARGLERAGADGLIVHGRTAAQGYSGRSDWNAIARIKEGVGIPIVGNGDVTDGPSAKRALETGVDGIALGRATLGNPRVFGELAHFLREGERAPRQSWEDRLEDLRAYVAMAQGIGIDPLNVREQAQQFTRGIPGGGEMRHAFTKMRDPAQMLAAFEAHLARRASAPAAR